MAVNQFLQGVNKTEPINLKTDIESVGGNIIEKSDNEATVGLTLNIKPPPEYKPVITEDKETVKAPKKSLLGVDTVPQDYYNEIANFWKDAKTWAVGEEFDNLGVRLQKGYGKSLSNRAIQYHSDLQSGVNFDWAMGDDLPDSGVLELVLEDAAEIAGDTPGFVLGGLLGSTVTAFATRNPALTIGGALYGAGFVNDSLKATYLEGLKRKLVGDPIDFATLYTNIGITEGHKGGKALVQTFGPARAIGGIKKGKQATKLGRKIYAGLSPGVRKAIDTINRYPSTRDYFTHLLVATALMANEVGGVKNINARDWQRTAILFGVLDYGIPSSKKSVDTLVKYSLEKSKNPKETIIDFFSDNKKRLDLFLTKEPKKEPLKEGKYNIKGPIVKGKNQTLNEEKIITRNAGERPNELSVLENAKVELNDFLYYPNKIYEKYKNPRPTVNWASKDGKVTWESFSKKWKDLWDKDDVQLLTPAENLRVIQQAQSKANNYLIDGIKDIGFDGKGNYKTISKGLNKWEKELQQAQIHPVVFSEYMINANLLGMANTRKDFNLSKFSTKKIQEIKKEQRQIQKNNPEIKEFAKDFYQMEKALAKMLRDSRVIGPAEYKKFLNGINKEKYITRKHLNRVEIKDKNKKGKTKEVIYETLGVTDSSKARKGSTKAIQNVITSLYESVYRTTQAAEYNLNMKTFFDFIADRKSKFPKEFEEWNIIKTPPKEKTIKVAEPYKLEIGAKVITKKQTDVTTSIGTNKGTIISIDKNKIEIMFVGKDGATSKGIFNKRDINFDKTTPFDKVLKYEEIPGYEQYKDTVLNNDGTVLSYQNKDNRIRFSRDGVQEVWGVPKEMRRAVEGYDNADLGFGMSILKGASDTLKLTATANPKFLSWTWFRDSFFLPVVSKFPSARTAIPILNITWGILAQLTPHLKNGRLTTRKAVENFRSSGGGQTIIETVFNDYKNYKKYSEKHPNDNRNYINSINQNGIIEMGINSDVLIKAGLKSTMIFENAGRYQEFIASYKALKKKFPNATEREIVEKSAYNAREIMNYGKYGNSAKTLNKISAFLVPAIRGFEKGISRITKENPLKSTVMLTLTQIIPVIYNHMQNVNDPDYIRDWGENPDKAGLLNYIMPIKISTGPNPNDFIWVKAYRPWGQGVFIGRLTEKLMDVIYKEDPIGFATWALSSTKQTAKSFAGFAIPTGFRPAGEALINYNLFTNSSVVPGKYEKYVNETDTRLPERVSELSKAISKLSGLNAFNIDHVIKGTVPGLGDQLLKKVDKIIRESTGESFPFITSNQPPYAYGKNFLQNIDQYPIIGHFFEKQGPRHNAAVQRRFWDVYNKLEKIYNTAKKYKDMGGAEGNKLRKEFLNKKSGGLFGFGKTNKTNKEHLKDYRNLIGKDSRITKRMTFFYKAIETCKYAYLNEKKLEGQFNDSTIRDCIDNNYQKLNKLAYKQLYKIGYITVDPDQIDYDNVIKKGPVDSNKKINTFIGGKDGR